MDSKTLIAVIATALIVAILTSLITVKLTGNVVNVRTGAEQQVYTKLEVDSLLKRVNAISCGGENGVICKTNSIVGPNDFYIDAERPGKINLMGNVNAPENLTVGGYSSGVSAATLNVIGNASISRGLSVRELAGSGNAYVCVNSFGKLYRSSSACTFK